MCKMCSLFSGVSAVILLKNKRLLNCWAFIILVTPFVASLCGRCPGLVRMLVPPWSLGSPSLFLLWGGDVPWEAPLVVAPVQRAALQPLELVSQLPCTLTAVKQSCWVAECGGRPLTSGRSPSEVWCTHVPGSPSLKMTWECILISASVWGPRLKPLTQPHATAPRGFFLSQGLP